MTVTLLIGSMNSNMPPSNYKQRPMPRIPTNLRSHVHSFLIFCATTACPYLPVSISHICNYLVFLSNIVSYATIKTHLSSLHLFYQLNNIPTDFPKDFWISLTLRGIKCIIGNNQASFQLLRVFSIASIQQLIFVHIWNASSGLPVCLLFYIFFGSPICFLLLLRISILNVT